MASEAAGHYYNDYSRINNDYADGWYIRKAKGVSDNVRELLIDWQIRRNRLDGQVLTETDLYSPLENGLKFSDIPPPAHLEYKHKKGKFEHLYRKHR